MKKFLSLLLVCGIAMTSFAQQATLMPLVAGDTIANTGTVNKQFTVTAGYAAAGVQIVITKISGTVAGTTKLQGSLNGSQWEDIGSSFSHTDVATQAKLFAVTGGVPYTYLRTTSTGSGTMSARVRLYYVLRKHD